MRNKSQIQRLYTWSVTCVQHFHLSSSASHKERGQKGTCLRTYLVKTIRVKQKNLRDEYKK